MSRPRPPRPLLAAAGMDSCDYNTGVVFSSDDTFRVNVTNGLTPLWGDHVALATCVEGQRAWHFAHFTPARARVLAMLLVDHADRIDALEDK